MPLKKLTGAFFALTLCCTSQVLAADQITKEQIRQVMAAADKAAKDRDVQGIAACLSERFFKYIDIPSDKRPATARIDKAQYLGLIERGWRDIEDYRYERKDVVVHTAADGSTGESFSTVVETFSVDGKPMKSKVREYARYVLEDGRAVILNVENQTLVGDTTP